MASTAPVDIEHCEMEASTSTEPTNIEEHAGEPTPTKVSEPQTAPTTNQNRLLVEQQMQQWNRSPVLGLAGRSGVGKSTMLNNFLALEGGQMCETGDDADPTTTEVKICSNPKYNVEVKVVDTPGLGGLKRSEVKKILKSISKSTEGTADVDILLYCVSLHPSGRIGTADAQIIEMLTTAYGPDIWYRTILTLTFANERKKLDVDAYRRLIGGYARNFQSALRTANIFGIQVKSILAEEVANGTIPAVPIGDDPKNPLPLCDNWSDALLMEVLKRANKDSGENLLKFKGHLLPAAEIGGCITTGIAVGTAVGTVAGAPVGVIPGIVVGVPAGAVAGGAIGLGIHQLLPWLRNKYLSRKANKQEGRKKGREKSTKKEGKGEEGKQEEKGEEGKKEEKVEEGKKEGKGEEGKKEAKGEEGKIEGSRSSTILL